MKLSRTAPPQPTAPPTRVHEQSARLFVGDAQFDRLTAAQRLAVEEIVPHRFLAQRLLHPGGQAYVTIGEFDTFTAATAALDRLQ